MSEMVGKEKGKGKDKVFRWSNDVTIVFLQICRDYRRKNGEDQPFSWVEIVEKLDERTGKKCDPTGAKNKFLYMKHLCRLWSELRYSETGVGWDAEKGMILAEDNWWAKKIKENKNYRRFRNKSVPPQMAGLWEEIFSSIVTTGKHAVATNCETPPDEDAENTNFSVEERQNWNLDEEMPGAATFNENLTMSLDEDCRTDEHLLHSVHDAITQGERSQVRGPAVLQVRKNATNGTGAPAQKRRKKPSSSKAAYNEHLAPVGGRSNRLLSMLEHGSTSSPQTQKKEFEFEDALEVIERFIAEGTLQDESPLYCYAMTELAEDKPRHVFMSIPRDSSRLAWLNFMFQERLSRK